MTEAARILLSELIDRYIAEVFDDHPQAREVAIQDRVLPVYFDMGGFCAVDCEGQVVTYLWDDTLHGQVEFDPRVRNIALNQGSKRYPELASLIEKPFDAQVCSHCNGSGVPIGMEGFKYPDAIVCYCGGLGWLP